MVDGVFSVQNDLRDGHKGIPILKQGFDDAGQGLRGMQCGIVEQDDGAGLHFGGDPLGDFGSRQLLPVQAVTIGNKGNPLGRNGLTARLLLRKRPKIDLKTIFKP